MDNITKITQRLEKFRAERRLLTAEIEALLKKGETDTAQDLQFRLDMCQNSLRYTEKKISAVLKHIRDPKLYNILQARIYTKMPWERVAEHIDCDVRTIYRLKKKAETEFNRIIALSERIL